MHVVNDHTMCATNKVESSISSKLKSFMGANFYFLLLNLLIVFLFFSPFMVRSQALTGTTGYYNIPTAELYPDRSMFIGTNLLNREYKKWGRPTHDAMDFFITNSFLPFAEVSIRFTRMIGLDDYSSTVGDRMASVRLRVIDEGRYNPAILIGVHSFFTTLSSGAASHFNSTYLVATKNFKVNHVFENIGFTTGYGSDVLKASDYQFIGFFGGVKITPYHLKPVELIVEYDADKWNVGARITILKHIVLLGGLEGFDAFSGGVSYKFLLP
ncbi:MAG: YjbH domain-containing protein [Bacteroidota bacterium]|jgi:hypothetical protein|nr:YjbH domain-containing protein [Bacteroidota bacterium]